MFPPSSGRCAMMKSLGFTGSGQRRWLWAAALVILLGAASVARAEGPAPVDPRLGCDAAAPPSPELTDPDNIDFFKQRLLYYRCTAYEADIAKVLGDARKWVAARA